MNRPRKIAIVFGLGCALMPASAIAQAPAAQPAEGQAAAAPVIPPDQQPTKEQLIRLFEVMRLRRQFDSMMKMMPAMVEQQIHAQMKEMLAKMPDAKEPTPEQQAAIDKLMNKYMEKAQTIYPVDEMIDDAATVYRRHMSRSDVDAYIAFYDSPAGQHLLDAQPVIMKEYMPMVTARIQERSKDLYAEMAQDIEEFIKTELPAKSPNGAAGATPKTDKPATK
jgi:hypothetical protein